MEMICGCGKSTNNGRNKCWTCYGREWNKRNPERRKELSREWNKRNPERRKELSRAGTKRSRMNQHVRQRERERIRKQLYEAPLKPWEDKESMFCDTRFLREFLGKEPRKGDECKGDA